MVFAVAVLVTYFPVLGPWAAFVLVIGMTIGVGLSVVALLALVYVLGFYFWLWVCWAYFFALAMSESSFFVYFLIYFFSYAIFSKPYTLKIN